MTWTQSSAPSPPRAGRRPANRRPSPRVPMPGSASSMCGIPTARRSSSCSHRPPNEEISQQLTMSDSFSADEDFALHEDREDSLGGVRERFHIPEDADGAPLIYFVGNSLGLMPKTTGKVVQQELDDWARLGVDAHLDGTTPWYSYHESVRGGAARL